MHFLTILSNDLLAVTNLCTFPIFPNLFVSIKEFDVFKCCSSHDSVCLLSRFHNSTVLKNYGSSQEDLRSRKKKRKDTSAYHAPTPLFTIKQTVCWASKTAKLFNTLVGTTTIVNLFYATLGISVLLVLHWMLTIFVSVFLLLSSFH